MKGNISISDFIIRIIFLVSLSGYLFPKKKKKSQKNYYFEMSSTYHKNCKLYYYIYIGWWE